jgi:predicted CXXCH cytochrome family protein
MAFVIHEPGTGSATTIRRFPGEALRIGRGTNNELRLDGALVALEHAEIEHRGGVYTVTDHGSATGTWVDGRRIESQRLADGDVLEIGGFRLQVALVAAGDRLDLLLELSPAVPAGPAEGPPLEERGPSGVGRAVHDYAGAYRLGRGGLTRGTLGAALALAATLAGYALVTGGRTDAFRPGPVSPAHASVIGRTDCAACHVPFQGSDDRGCAGCHRDHPLHQASQAVTPPCGGCHTEHRGLDRLTRVTDRSCTNCHGELAVKPGAAVRFATTITGFAADHPPFAVDQDGTRVPVARVRDDNPLRFGHERHLGPLKVPGGTFIPTCEDCHRPATGEDARRGRRAPIRYQDHCQRCHELVYDLGLPEDRLPHAEPPLVSAYILRAFAADATWRRLSFEERRRLLVTDPVRGPGRLSQRELREANQAEGYAFGVLCVQCHELSRDRPVPRVAPVRTGRDWLPYGFFPHDRHRVDLACEDCHRAAGSHDTADLLLPEIDTCRRCHGDGIDGANEATAAAERVPSRCTDCHDYHGETSFPGAAAVAALEGTP